MVALLQTLGETCAITHAEHDGPRRRILILGLNYSPEQIGIGPYTAGLAEALAERGHKVHAVVGQPYYPDWRLHDRYHRSWKHTVENGVSITRCPHYIPANPTGRKRLVHHLSFASAAYAKVAGCAKRLRPDLIFTVAPSMIAVPVAQRAARRMGIPLWLHIQDFEVGAALATGLMGGGRRRLDAALAFERRMLEGADLVSTISPAMRDMLIAKGRDPDRVIELRNWANHAASIGPADGTDLKRSWGLADKTVALYSGNISHKQGLDGVIVAARSLVRRGDIAFVIAGEGPLRQSIEQQVAGLPNVTLKPLQEGPRVGEMLRMADIHLLPQIEGAADLVLPSKIGNMLTSARPVVATVHPGSGIADELTGCGAIVPPGDPEALARAIVGLADDPARRASMGELGAERARMRWSKRSVVDQFEARMQALLA